MMEKISLFAFANGCDKIVIGSSSAELAMELAFEQCNDNNQPLFFLGEIEWDEQMRAMMPYMQMNGITIH